MAKLTVPRPGPRSDRPAKMQVDEKKSEPPKPPEEIALDADDLEEVDNTEPSGPPVVVEPAPKPVALAPVAQKSVVRAPLGVPPPPVWLAPPVAPIFAPSPLAPAPADLAPRPPMRSLATSLSDFELDSIRKSSPSVLERRKQLQKLVASAVGVAWFICIVALGQMGLRSIIASVAGP